MKLNTYANHEDDTDSTQIFFFLVVNCQLRSLHVRSYFMRFVVISFLSCDEFFVDYCGQLNVVKVHDDNVQWNENWK